LARELLSCTKIKDNQILGATIPKQISFFDVIVHKASVMYFHDVLNKIVNVNFWPNTGTYTK
jgi:hypothetical protein